MYFPKKKIYLITAIACFGFFMLIGMVRAWTNPIFAPPGGTGALFFDGTNFGIGTSTPGGKLGVTVNNGGNRKALIVTQNDTTNNPTATEIVNAGSGDGIFIDQNGNGRGLYIDHDGANHGIQVDMADTGTANVGVNINITGGARGLRINKLGNTAQTYGLAYFANNDAADATPILYLDNRGTGNGIFLDQNNAGRAINIDGDANSASNLYGVYVDVVNAGSGKAYGAYFNNNVGIGTSTPQAKLHIGGTPGADGIMFPDGTLQTTAATGGGSGFQELNFMIDPDMFNTTGGYPCTYPGGSCSPGYKLHTFVAEAVGTGGAYLESDDLHVDVGTRDTGFRMNGDIYNRFRASIHTFGGNFYNSFFGLARYRLNGNSGSAGVERPNDTGTMTQNHIGFVGRASTGSTAFLYASVANGSSQTQVAIGGVNLDVYNTFAFAREGGTVTFYVNGVSRATINTNLPTTPQNMSFNIFSSAAAGWGGIGVNTTWVLGVK
ncbi:MAG: hypothetical protein V1652_00150 [bacterium]